MIVIALADGEGPEVALSDLVTLITALPVTVTRSVLTTAGAVPPAGVTSVAVIVMLSVAPLVAPPGTVPATTNWNTPLAASAPVLVIAVALSGTPSPLASAKIWIALKPKPPATSTVARLKVSLPLPVLVSVCGKYTVCPGAAGRLWSATRVKLETCCTMVCTVFEVEIRGTADASV